MAENGARERVKSEEGGDCDEEEGRGSFRQSRGLRPTTHHLSHGQDTFLKISKGVEGGVWHSRRSGQGAGGSCVCVARVPSYLIFIGSEHLLDLGKDDTRIGKCQHRPCVPPRVRSRRIKRSVRTTSVRGGGGRRTT